MSNKTELRAAAARLLYNNNRDSRDYNMLIEYIDNSAPNEKVSANSVKSQCKSAIEAAKMLYDYCEAQMRRKGCSTECLFYIDDGREIDCCPETWSVDEIERKYKCTASYQE